MKTTFWREYIVISLNFFSGIAVQYLVQKGQRILEINEKLSWIVTDKEKWLVPVNSPLIQ